MIRAWYLAYQVAALLSAASSASDRVGEAPICMRGNLVPMSDAEQDHFVPKVRHSGMKLGKQDQRLLDRLRSVLNGQRRRYRELAGATDFADYLSRKPERQDEEILVEPVLQELMEEMLGFPKDGYFAQFSRGGLKPDLTPMDPIAHSFVLDAKSSLQTKLGSHERQIREYVVQRNLRFGVLFNLREFRVYRRDQTGHDPELSFEVLPLWELASGHAMLADPHLQRFLDFVSAFRYREMGGGEGPGGS